MKSKELYLGLLAYVRPQWRMFAFWLLMMVVLAATEPVLPAMMKPMLDGSLVETGAHAELLAQGGTYTRLHTLQFREDGSHPRH